MKRSPLRRMVWAVILAGCASPTTSAPGRAPLSLVYAARGEGELEPCG